MAKIPIILKTVNCNDGTVDTFVLDATLRVSANSTSCCVVHQPKAPKKLETFQKFK